MDERRGNPGARNWTNMARVKGFRGILNLFVDKQHRHLDADISRDLFIEAVLTTSPKFLCAGAGVTEQGEYSGIAVEGVDVRTTLTIRRSYRYILEKQHRLLYEDVNFEEFVRWAILTDREDLKEKV